MNKHLTSMKIKRFDFTTDAGVGARARIGLLVLESDQTMEWEFTTLTDLPEVAVYHARLENEVTVTSENLIKMAEKLPIAARLLPDYLGVNVIGYGCTSASTLIGEERVAEIINQVHKGIRVTNPLSAAKAALKAMGVKRLALLTPYSSDITTIMCEEFIALGIEVCVVGSFYEESDAVVGKIDYNSIRAAAIEIGKIDGCDGVFISCTSLRAAHIIEDIEHAIGKPVTASNHALAWHCLRLAGVNDIKQGLGQLYHKQLV